MGGRNGKPIQLHVAQGNPNRLTKSEIERRQNSEVKVGTQKLTCPAYVKNDVVAFAKWKEVIKVYKGVDFVSSGDVGLLSRYCMTHSEYVRLCGNRKKLETLHADWERYQGALPENFIYAMEALIRIDHELQLETAINKKMDMLIKMEDRLFLNPLAKVKNVPKKEPEKSDPAREKFGV
ncbi:MAG: hypothetical protein WA118_08800 [Carboxydocellales bacterium]